MSKTGYVYILASRKHGTLYTGVTSDLVKRIAQHIEGTFEGFTKDRGVKILVYFEILEDIENAITREKQVKNWKREWKIQAIEKDNPDWYDLYPTLF
jgi:putative endonuclease